MSAMSKIVITPPGRLALPSARELWEAREVLYRFGQRDVLLRYRQTAVGVAWVFVQPLAAAGIFAIVFGQVAELPSGGVPYFLFTFMGMLAWNLFSGVVGRAAPSLVGNQALVSKVFFPRLIVPMASALAVFIDFAVALGLGVVLLVIYGVNPGWAVLLLPVWAFLLALMGSGIALAASAIMVKYRDVGYVLPWIMQVLLYASPVAYSLEAVPDNLRWIFTANPLTWFLEGFRFSLLGLPAPPAWQIVGAVVAPVVVFFLGLLAFQRFEREFADVI